MTTPTYVNDGNLYRFVAFHPRLREWFWVSQGGSEGYEASYVRVDCAEGTLPEEYDVYEVKERFEDGSFNIGERVPFWVDYS
ncbi:hypothetical protein [uncultured Roseibium sp.]|uniref:hypothetical protein n=1 Tax=uncultured Roseibium sp. TaxID=1936171 RepID=UPI002612118B|nr:hypothetical protein [uncultured Roseibium sp.]